MIKRLFSFVCCLAPFGANAAQVYLPVNVNDNVVITDPANFDTTVNTYIVQYGNDVNGIILENMGLDLSGNLNVWATSEGSTSGSLAIMNASAATTPKENIFTLKSQGDVTIAGALNVLAGNPQNRGFTLTTVDGGAPINMTINAINNAATLSLLNANLLRIGSVTGGVFTPGTVETNGNFTVGANALEMGAMTATGTVRVTVDNSAQMGQVLNGTGAVAGDMEIIAGDIQTTGSVINTLGTMNLLARNGDITIDGNLENSGTQMGVQASGNVIVSGTMKNDSQNGVMSINAVDFRVNGGAFANAGNLTLRLTGDMFIRDGFDLSAMGDNNVFDVQAKTLAFGGAVELNNYANTFKLNVTGGGIDLQNGNIFNGQGNNPNANMTLSALSLKTQSITNAGQNLSIVANVAADDDTTGVVTVDGTISGNAGSQTFIVANGGLTAGGATNMGEMALQGPTIVLDSIVNEGKMAVQAATSDTGSIKIASTVTNNAENNLLRISARMIEIGGAVTNNAGDMLIRGSDNDGGNIVLGALSVAGGNVTLNALINDGIKITNDLSVQGGVLNLGTVTRKINVGGAATFAGDVIADATSVAGAGNVNVLAGGVDGFTLTAVNSITVGGNIIARANDVERRMVFDAPILDVRGGVSVANRGYVTFGDTLATNVTVAGAVTSDAGGVVDFKVDDVDVGSLTGTGKIIMRGTMLTANDDTASAMDIQNGIWMGTNTSVAAGLVGLGDSLTIQTAGQTADINVAGGVSVAPTKTLNLDSQHDINIVGGIENNQGTIGIVAKNHVGLANDITTNTGVMRVTASAIDVQDIANNGTVELTATGAGAINTQNINVNSGTVDMDGGVLTSSSVHVAAGQLDVTGASWDIYNMSVDNGAATTVNTDILTAAADVSVGGDLVQGVLGGVSGALNLIRNNMVVHARNLGVNGNFNAVGMSVDYVIENLAQFNGGITVAPAGDADFTANRIMAGDVDNTGTLRLSAQNGMTLGIVTGRDGVMTLDSGAYYTNVSSFDLSRGVAVLGGKGLISTGAFNIQGRLQQNAQGASAGDINVVAPTYAITAPTMTVGGIMQADGEMVLNTSDLDVHGDVLGKKLRIMAQGKADSVDNNWLTVNIDGDIKGGVEFVGLKSMDVGGSYIFDNASMLHAAVMPSINVGGRNYWASVSLKDDNTLGTITNNGGANAEPLISVNGKFVSNVTQLGDEMNGAPLTAPQIGIDIFDMIDQGTAIWLMHADGGLDELALKMRNLYVKFCNADGSQCFDYINSIKLGNNGATAKEDLPAYLTTRDTDGDGIPDSIYIVFDPRFGGPVQVFKIQSIVGREAGHTDGEYAAAGALDNLVAGQLAANGFVNRTPIEAIPLIFKDTVFAQLGQQLYDRMEDYNTNRDGAPLTQFSRLVQPREVEQIMGGIVLNEHTTFRDFEDRMFDEFIWNRNRNLKKVWVDVDYGMYSQRATDGKDIDGDRFSAAAGFDWQSSQTLIMGLTGRVSHMSGSNSDDMELGYKAGQHIAGHMDVDVSNTNIGLGGYLLKTLGTKARLYGNAFADIHLLDVTRHQTYVDEISGDGTAFALTTEWGFMHDWLNQYIVGNLYARAGYNFGFAVTEKAAGQTYMDLESDGYVMLTPGYTLMAQKRIYPNAWSQLRPYLAVGVEYDVLGAPDNAKYKFGPAQEHTDYNLNLDPLWANAGGGVEFLMANGVQVGLDYRYQYNSEIQLHQIKLSGSYRF